MKKGIKQNTIRKTIRVLIAVLALFLFNIDARAEITFSQNFSYTGNIQEVTIPYTGIYKLETWGAQGGTRDVSHNNYGAYSVGNILLQQGEVLYIGVGGQGASLGGQVGTVQGGYNGGGSYTATATDQAGNAGGGATHIAIENNRGELKNYSSYRDEIIIVSGGGGASSRSNNLSYNHYQGSSAAGGISSADVASYHDWNGANNKYFTLGGKATQTSGNDFGQGASSAYNAAGGGGGWYGGGWGGVSHFISSGGSSYIGNEDLTDKHMTCYNCTTSTEESTKTISTTSHSSTPTADYAKDGSGYAKVTLMKAYAYLDELEVTKGNLTENFVGNKTNYTWIIPKGVDTLTDEDVVATPVDPESTVIIPESVSFTQDGDTFEILVINDDVDRNTYTLTMQRYVSNDGRLASISSDKGYFKETFDPDNKNYTLEIFEDADTVTLDATAYEQDNQGITGLGEITLNDYEQDTQITSTAEDGTIEVYNIHIIKDMYLKNIEIEGLGELECESDQCTLNPEFSPEIDSYTIKVPYEYERLNVTYEPSHEGLTVGIRLNTQNYTKNQVLPKINNTIKFNIYTDNNSILKTYTVSLKRVKKDEGSLKDLKVNKGRLVETFKGNKYDYTWIIPKGTTSVTKNDVVAKLADSKSTLIIPDNLPYTQDGDEFNIAINYPRVEEFNYTGGIQEFAVPFTGQYKLETWGAQGGTRDVSHNNYGAYAVGTITLDESEVLYIGVGGQGASLGGQVGTVQGGYNGGGSYSVTATDQSGNAGGGATHIAIGNNRGELKNYSSYRDEIIIVSGGGGASSRCNNLGYNHYQGSAAAGGISSSNVASYHDWNGANNKYYSLGGKATQTSGNAFGQGASSGNNAAGGGGGWYGGGWGGVSHFISSGGSSYIGNEDLTDKHMTCYGCTTSTEESTKTIATTNHSSTPKPDYAKDGNGFARITLLDSENLTKTYTLSLQMEVSDDARLATLTADKGLFTEEFDKDKDEYVLEMYHKETSVTLDATPFEQDAEVIDGLGEIDLPTDETTHTITVQAEDGTIKIYTVIIRRNMYIEDLGLNGLDDLYCRSYECHLTPTFSPEVINYEIRVPLDYNTLDAYYEPASSEHRSEMTINGEPYEEGYALPFTGTTVVQVHVYNDNDEIVKTYTMNVIKKYEYTEEFDYTGDYQIFVAPRTGLYKLNTWGAQGDTNGGRGAYATSENYLNKGDILYVYVGGAGNTTNTGGYNGGGACYVNTVHSSYWMPSGGGATDIRLVPGVWNNTESLESRILVAGGGGGGNNNNTAYGYGGGINTKGNATAYAGVQTTYAGTLGQGGSCGITDGRSIGGQTGDNYTAQFYGGGGGGYYGGSGIVSRSSGPTPSWQGYISGVAEGGSSYVEDQDNGYAIAGNQSMPTHDGEGTMTGNTGNGYAKINLLETETMLESLSVDDVTLVEPFDKFRTEYTWIIPKGKDEFTSDDVEAVILHPDKAHIEWPSEPVQFTQDGDKFVFKVVADNGEEDTYTLTMIRYKSDDARLKSLTSDKGVLNPTFDPDENSYVLNVFEDIDKITLDAETINPDAVIGSGIGEIELEENEVTKEILVTAEDGTTNVYTVIIRKNAYLLYLGLINLENYNCVEDECILVPPFDPESNEYNIKVPYEYANIDIYYLLASDEYTAQLKLNGNTYIEGASLPVGESTVEIDIYNENDVKVNTYTMVVDRQKGNYATLDNLEVSIGEFNVPFRREVEEYTWIIPYDTAVVLDDYVTATPTDPAATVSMPESITYSQDGDEFNITVTAEDGVTTKTYKLRLQRDIIEDIEVNDTLVVPMGDHKNLYVNGLPDGCEGIFLYEIDQNAIAYVDDYGDVYGLFPGTATITISVKNHPEIDAKTVHVTVVSDKLESDIYEVRDDSHDSTDYRMVVGAEDGTTISEFKDNMLNPNEYIKIYDKDGNEVEDDEIVKTGLTIKLEINGTVHDEASMVVKGDVDGDGFINVTDYISVLNHALALEDIEDYIKFVAGDVAEDEILNVTDYIKIMDYALGNIDSINN